MPRYCRDAKPWGNAARLLTIILSSWLAASAGAQSGDETSFGDSVDVRVINLEAVVTDQAGNRVFDLYPDDFQLLVDGQEIPIDFFTEVRDGRAAPVRATETPATAPLQAMADPGQPVGTSYLVFIDDLLSVGAQRNAVIDGLIDTLDTLDSADRMAIVAYDGSIELLTRWTGSKAQLTDTLVAAKKRRAHGLRHIAARINFGADAGRPPATGLDARSAAVTGVLDPTADRQSDREQIDDLRRLSDAVTSAMRGAPRTAGRKVMMLLAGGWPAELFFDPNDSYFGAPADNRLTRPIIETANLLGYTLYTVGVDVLSSGRIDDNVAEGGFEDNVATTGEPGVGAVGLASQSTLRILAAATGGRAQLFDQRLEALPAVAADTKSYYWLGFNAPRRGDDATHQIKIKVRKPGLTVRSRGAYRDLSRAREFDLLTQSALMFGTDPGDGDEQSPLLVEAGPVVAAGFRRMDVPVRITVAARELLFLPSAEGVAANVEFRFGAKEANGYRPEIATTPLRWTSDAQPAPNHRFIYETTMRVRKRPHSMVVTLVDTSSGRLLNQQVSFAP